MMMRGLIALAAGAIGYLAACTTPKILNPDGPPPTCGYWRVDCLGADGRPNGMCCAENNACLPDGMCEYVGPDHGYGKRPKTPQRRIER